MHQQFIHSYQLFMKHLPYAKLSTSLGNQVNKITCMANREGDIINKLRAWYYKQGTGQGSPRSPRQWTS